MPYTFSGLVPSKAAIVAAAKTDLSNAPKKPAEFALYILTVARAIETLQKAEHGTRQ